ncbi:hypothetical protein ISCGN_029911 [Ixodes scapularis]
MEKGHASKGRPHGWVLRNGGCPDAGGCRRVPRRISRPLSRARTPALTLHHGVLILPRRKPVCLLLLARHPLPPSGHNPRALGNGRVHGGRLWLARPVAARPLPQPKEARSTRDHGEPGARGTDHGEAAAGAQGRTGHTTRRLGPSGHNRLRPRNHNREFRLKNRRRGMESPHGTLQRGTLEVRKDDFWEAISSNYDYLMNDELIASCRRRVRACTAFPKSAIFSLPPGFLLAKSRPLVDEEEAAR